MKPKYFFIAIIVVAIAAGLWLFRSHRGGDLPGAAMEGRDPSRPTDVPATVFDSRPPQSVALQSSTEPEGPMTATAQITRSDGSAMEIRLMDGEYGRIQVEPNEVLKIRLALRGIEAGREVRIDADHGGSLNRQRGALKLIPARGQDAIEFQYAVGGHKGRYTLIVSQGLRQELLEFRVGPEPPTGQPGPRRQFNRDNT